MDDFSLIRCICFLEINIEESFRRICCYQPLTTQFGSETEYLIQNCVSNPPKSTPNYYAFSLLNYTGFSVLFEKDEKFYSLVIISSFLYPSLYFEYLHEAFKFIISKGLSLEESLDYFWKQLSQWKLIFHEKVNLPFPFDIRSKKLNDFSNAFENYDPWTTFPNHMRLYTAWRALIICASIKIIADDEVTLTKAVFSLLSLLEPYKYSGKVLLILDSHDRRLKNADKYPIVGVLKNIDQSVVGNFSCVLTQSQVLEDDYDQLRKDQFERMEKIQSAHLYLLDSALLTNPYNDLLELPYIKNDIEKELKTNSNTLISSNELRLFLKTDTAIWFRKMNIFRDSFRNALLSVPIEDFIKNSTKEQLEKILEFIPKLRIIYKNDAHVISVLKIHSKSIDQLLHPTK